MKEMYSTCPLVCVFSSPRCARAALENLQNTSQREEIRKTASGALWVIQGHHQPDPRDVEGSWCVCMSSYVVTTSFDDYHGRNSCNLFMF